MASTTVIGLGQGVTTYEPVEEWLDWNSTTNGTGSWVHPVPGTPINMTIISIGGSGGNADNVSGGLAGTGSMSSFAGVNGPGGGGAQLNGRIGDPAQPYAPSGSYSNTNMSRQPASVGFGLFGMTGTPNQSAATSTIYLGAVGGVTIQRVAVSGSQTYLVGKGGDEGNAGYGNGLPGGIILKYAIPRTN